MLLPYRRKELLGEAMVKKFFFSKDSPKSLANLATDVSSKKKKKESKNLR